MTAGGPSFIGAPRWPIDQGAIRLRMSDRAVARLPAVMGRLGDRMAASPQGSKLRRSVMTRALVAGFAAHDQKDLAYLQRVYSSTIRFESRLEAFDLLTGVYEGWEEVAGYLRAYWEIAATLETRLLEAIDVGGAFFAARLEVKATGDFSGLGMGADAVVLYEFDGGRVGRQWSVTDEEAAERIVADRLAG